MNRRNGLGGLRRWVVVFGWTSWHRSAREDGTMQKIIEDCYFQISRISSRQATGFEKDEKYWTFKIRPGRSAIQRYSTWSVVLKPKTTDRYQRLDNDNSGWNKLDRSNIGWDTPFSFLTQFELSCCTPTPEQKMFLEFKTQEGGKQGWQEVCGCGCQMSGPGSFFAMSSERALVGAVLRH